MSKNRDGTRARKIATWAIAAQLGSAPCVLVFSACSGADSHDASGASTAGAATASAGSSGAGTAGGSLGGAPASAGSGADNTAGQTSGSSGSANAASTGGSAGSGGAAAAGGAQSSAGASGASGVSGNSGSSGTFGGGPAPYAPCPASGNKCAIMPLGDSITEGYNSTTGGGYRLRLLHDIWAASHDATFVGNNSSGPTTLDGKPFPRNNEGHSGYTIDPAPALNRSGISPLVAASLKKSVPQIVTLMIGTNDIGTNNDVANAPTRLGNLLDIITSTSPNALVVVGQIPPLGDGAGNSRAQKFNAAIPDLVKPRVAAGKHIVVVDMYAPFSAHPEYMNGLHPNDTGYDFMGDIWFKALTPYL